MVVGDKFVFIHLQKCAGSFVDNLLPRIFPDAKWNKVRHDSVSNLKPKHAGKTVFGTIRNPWDWWVSWASATNYGNKLRGPNKERLRAYTFEGFWDAIFTTKLTLGELNMAQANELGIGPYTYRFVLRYFRDPQRALNNWDTEEVLRNIDDLMYPIHLCRVENLRNELISFFESIGIELNDSQMHELMCSPVDNPSKHSFTESYFDERLQNLVSEKDRLIVDLYGYSKPWV